MSVALFMDEVMTLDQYLEEAVVSVNTYELNEGERNEVLAFLSERPVHTICMAGLIRDNGIVSEHNRGTFYGCRNSEGRLEGVALVGHATLVEARTRRATEEFALTAQGCTRTHMIMGEADHVEEFWNAYADQGQRMKLACRELLFDMREAPDVSGREEGLRLANEGDLDLVVAVHAGLAEAECGTNPLDTDPEGFRSRCVRRIQMGRVWVVVKDDRLIFKADIQADTSDVVYIEGVYVHPSVRGTGLGRRCMTQLGRDLLRRTRRVCLLVNEENQRAHAFYRLCGFRLHAVYDTIFLEQSQAQHSRLVQ